MRIVYIHQFFKTPLMSGGNRSYEMAKRLAARGHEVHMVTSSMDRSSRDTEIVNNFTVHWIPVPYGQKMSYRKRLKAFATFAFKSSVIARKLKGDVVFATSTPLTVAIPGIFASAFRKSPLIFEVRDLWPDVPIALGALNNRFAQLIAHILEKITYSYASHIVALSPDMKAGIVGKGINENKVSVIPNASDNDLFQASLKEGQQFREKYTWLGDRKLVLYCGTLGLVNDVSYIAKLAAEVKKADPQIRFMVIGRGNDEERVCAKAKALGVYEKNFFILPPVPKVEVPAILAAADLSMSTVAPIPELFANSANKVFDSFASGTPLAINHGGWLAQLIEAEEAGLVLSMSDITAAAEALIDFLNSPEKIKLASENSKRLAFEKFDRQLLAEKLAVVLERAATKK
ncbi:Glycosyltransferase [Corynebacterium glutamicum]|uniref:glycosyltransferase family 4 protein n=1 Tax=Corynebacterium glutamicum TaxID=1718 RepID=UPI00097EA762|nr:glycosyltransferase family 4 protein [Corynebacterium glutamicum]SJM65959.1 Glycosyltransferase [Corynebacterium glutamicum]